MRSIARHSSSNLCSGVCPSLVADLLVVPLRVKYIVVLAYFRRRLPMPSDSLPLESSYPPRPLHPAHEIHPLHQHRQHRVRRPDSSATSTRPVEAANRKSKEDRFDRLVSGQRDVSCEPPFELACRADDAKSSPCATTVVRLPYLSCFMIRLDPTCIFA